MSEPISFAEHSCWNDEDFRVHRKPVVFRLTSVGEYFGRLVNVDFTADYGIWYDQDDSVLMWHLNQADPTIQWRDFVFYRKWDHSCIEIFSMATEETVAMVRVRAEDAGSSDDVDDLGSNVLRMSDYTALRMSERPPCPTDDDLILELTDVYTGPAPD